MPWKPRYSREEAERAIEGALTWADALRRLNVAAVGKNFATLRRWAEKWEIPVAHLRPPGKRGPGFTEEQARVAITQSRSWAESLRRLNYAPSGGNPRTLKAWAERWGISTEHFDAHRSSLEGLKRGWSKRPLSEILIENSDYSRSQLKGRLYREGLKEPICELCGQGEDWKGRMISMILDHINGVRNDNRIENLRIVCPNCAASLDTHCGRKNRQIPRQSECLRCGGLFRPKYRDHRYCSRECGSRWDRGVSARPRGRKVDRPSYTELVLEVKDVGYSAVGRKYGVSDNAIRKWIRQYERERAVEEGRDPKVVEIPARTWPNRRNNKKAA